MFALREPARAALQVGDQAQMVALLKQVVTIWRTVDLDQLRLAHRLALANGFAPSLDQRAGAGGADDIVAKTIVPRCCAPNIEMGSRLVSMGTRVFLPCTIQNGSLLCPNNLPFKP
jgi:hypothetical protein